MCVFERRRGSKGEPSPGVPPSCFRIVRVRRYVGRWSMACPAIRPHFFGACPKKRCRAAKEKRFFYPGGSTIRVSAAASVDYTFLARLGGRAGACRGLVRVRRFLGQKSLPPTADSTPFLCSCAKKRGGAPKKRAYGCRHGRCWVPPASPTGSKPQHHSRLRQADLSARSTTKPLPKSGEERIDYRPVALTRMVEPPGYKRRFSLAARHRFFGQAPKKWGRRAGQAIDHRPA